MATEFVADTAGLNDRTLIAELLDRWACARDSDDWGTLTECFHADARIHISWISASGEEFVRRSRAMAAGRKPGRHMKHIVSSACVEVNGTRGFSRSNATLMIRDCIGDAWYDLQSHIRFFDRLEARDGVWRILERTAVYDKDRIDHLDGSSSGERPWNGPDFVAYPPEARHLCWWLVSRGLEPLPDLVCVYGDAEARLGAECDRWINF